MQKVTKKQNFLVLLSAVALVLCAIGGTVYVTELMQKSKAEAQQGYQNITFTDAVLSCEKQALGEFSSDLSQPVLDRHSSRSDNDALAYMTFLMPYTNARKTELTAFFITCYGKSRNGPVSKSNVCD